MTNAKFSYNKTTEQIAEDYQRLSNPVSAFVADMCEEDPEEYTIKDELYNTFKSYCKNNGYPVFSEKKFAEWLKKEVNVSQYRPIVNGQRPTAWQGIKLLPSPSVRGVRDVKDSSNFKSIEVSL